MRRRRVLDSAIDVALALTAAVAGVVLELRDPGWFPVAAQIAGAGSLLVRRRWPYVTAGVLVVLNVFVPVWATVLAPYALVAFTGERARWRPWAATGLLVVTFLIGARAWQIADPFSAPLVLLCSALLGLYARARASLAAEATRRATEQARADERVRLAGEMHDVVTHRLNLMVLQAGAMRMTAPDDTTREAADELRTAGVQALAELRDLVGVLRDGADPARAEGGDVAELVEQSRAVGLPVRLTITGDESTPSPAVQRTVVRVVQEALTNVHKHAPGAATEVTLAYADEGISVEVVNERSGRSPRELPSGGAGLTGLRYRVEMVGGSFAAGPAAGGGFRVSVRLPAYVPTAQP
ncbi:histidine kinase [Actinoplanes sp. Pm04-4]|uniref:histidine kinase n=1 Tax=Paractinoplanes pyxinae TaxID=2997416 RepID=A0ABT4ASC2_9ACTN|nr:histidine kinase [Actinoplanes pyxinae]MCY1137131.1 histidine kinase [Actinoplanes pyxinae]